MACLKLLGEVDVFLPLFFEGEESSPWKATTPLTGFRTSILSP